jgi:hypothetical protein
VQIVENIVPVAGCVTQLSLFRGLVKSQFSPISPNPQAAVRRRLIIFSIGICLSKRRMDYFRIADNPGTISPCDDL